MNKIMMMFRERSGYNKEISVLLPSYTFTQHTAVYCMLQAACVSCRFYVLGGGETPLFFPYSILHAIVIELDLRVAYPTYGDAYYSLIQTA